MQRILNEAGLGRLNRGDRATNNEPVIRYQRERPGQLIHVDIKKLAAIPYGGGWWTHGRGNDTYKGHAGAGYRFIHTAIDDRTRMLSGLDRRGVGEFIASRSQVEPAKQ